MKDDTAIGGSGHINVYTAAEGSRIATRSPALPAQVEESGLNLPTFQAGQTMRSRAVTIHQATVLGDLALTVLQQSRGKAAAMATILSGKLNELEPKDFGETMAFLVNCLSDSSLDRLGRLFGVRRGNTDRARSRFEESDTRFAARLLYSLPWPATDAYQLVGISLRTVLHFRPQVTLAQQEAAIEKTIKAVEDEIVLTEADRTFRLNDLWVIVRFTAQDVVIDAGEPNRPFEEILLWRGEKPEPLVGNYIVKPGEYLVIEPSLPAAIDIRPAGGRLDR